MFYNNTRKGAILHRVLLLLILELHLTEGTSVLLFK